MPATDKLKHLVIHTSDSAWGDVTEITKWHIAKGWTTIGYHYVITNPYPTYNDLKKKTPQLAFNGKVCLGRDTDHDGDVDEEIGAHTLGYNTKSIGICLIGKKGVYTDAQILSVIALCTRLCIKYNIPVANVIGHYESASGKAEGKTCPDMEMNEFRRKLSVTLKIATSPIIV